MNPLAFISFEAFERQSVYLLVLGAVVVGVLVLAHWLKMIGEERAERLDEKENAAGALNGISYFISPGKLFRLRLNAGTSVAALVIATMLVCGVTELWMLLLGGAIAGLIVAYEIRAHFVGKVKKRAIAFQAQMLDFSLGLSNGLKAGQALPQALELYSKNAAEPLFGELRIVQREYHLGVDLAEALTRMHNRIPCEDLQLMIVSIKLTMTSGGSLASVLEKMTNTIRSRDDFHRKLMALTAQGRFEALAMSLAPVAAFLILMAVNSELMMPLLTTVKGWIAIGVDAALILTGYTVIRKITNVEV